MTNEWCMYSMCGLSSSPSISVQLFKCHCMRLLVVIFAQFTLRKSCYRHLPLWKCVIFEQNYRNVFVRRIFLRVWLWIRIRIREQIKKNYKHTDINNIKFLGIASWNKPPIVYRIVEHFAKLPNRCGVSHEEGNIERVKKNFTTW